MELQDKNMAGAPKPNPYILEHLSLFLSILHFENLMIMMTKLVRPSSTLYFKFLPSIAIRCQVEAPNS